MAKRSVDVVADTLQRYADRGVFRRFSARPGRGGRREFRFEWLTRRPITLTYDPRTRALRFSNLLPAVGTDRDLVTELTALVAGRTATIKNERAVPAHRRIDSRRASVISSVRGGHLSLTLTARGPHEVYLVRRGLMLVQELFLRLLETYPDYLSEHFEMSTE